MPFLQIFNHSCLCVFLVKTVCSISLRVEQRNCCFYDFFPSVRMLLLLHVLRKLRTYFPKRLVDHVPASKVKPRDELVHDAGLLGLLSAQSFEKTGTQ